MFQEGGFLVDDSLRFTKGENVPTPQPDENIMTKA
jgi:hypothetical protein